MILGTRLLEAMLLINSSLAVASRKASVDGRANAFGCLCLLLLFFLAMCDVSRLVECCCEAEMRKER
jgi:hypothetical protein